MMQAELRALRHLARWHGILTEYKNVAGRKVVASPTTLQAVLRAIGVPLDDPADAPRLLEQAKAAHWLQPLDPVTVAWCETGGQAEVRLQEKQERFRGRIRLDSGESQALTFESAPITARARIDGSRYLARSVRLPKRLPPGYHTLELDGKNFSAQSRLFVAPLRAWQPNPPTRSWGVFLPLYAIHSSRGTGSYSTLAELAEWTAAQGGQMVSTLPLLPLFLPDNPSPFSPISKLFWNEFYVDVKAVPEWSACVETSRRTTQTSTSARVMPPPPDRVNYHLELPLKRSILEALARFFFSKPSKRRAEFERWLHPEVQRYATFRAITDARGESWSRWPEQLRRGLVQDGDYDPRVRDYHLYVQWIAQQQMAAVSARTRELGVRLYLDMPLGVSADGYDVWRDPSLFVPLASGGAPPDPVFTKGQEWGFAPVHPQRIREQGYRYVIESLQHHLRHAGALRFDHVMALHRLFWVPRDLSAAEGAYVEYRSEELYAILSLESHRHQSLIVGENLGTVPPAVNKAMNRHGLRQMYVVQYETRPLAQRALRPVPAQTVAALNTHDMPPFAAFWEGLDVADRGDLGLLSNKAVLQEKRLRQKLIKALEQFLHRRESRVRGQRSGVADLLKGCLAYLSASQAEWVLINLEDLWLETRSQNTPGTTTERVNWRGRANFSLEEWLTLPAFMTAIQIVQRARPRSKKP